MGLTLYTVGTSNRSWEEFVAILHHYGIRYAIDVRRFPKSYWPHFHRNFLMEHLPDENIQYIWLGETLGGFRKAGYEAYIETPEFREGLIRLITLAKKGPSVFFCKERFPWKCHRRYIAAVLRKEGYRVVHIIERDRVWKPHPPPEIG